MDPRTFDSPRIAMHLLSRNTAMPTSSEPYRELAEALRQRLALIADRDFYQRDPQGHLDALRDVSHRIDTARDALPRPIPGELAHYLHGASLSKALAWIEAHTAA
jgi:hypothetical protein